MYNLFFLHCNMLFYFWSKYDPDQFLILFLLMYTLQYAVFNCSPWLFFTRHILIHCSIKRPLIQAMMIWLEFLRLISVESLFSRHKTGIVPFTRRPVCSHFTWAASVPSGAWPAGLSSNLPSSAQQNLNDRPSASGWSGTLLLWRSSVWSLEL